MPSLSISNVGQTSISWRITGLSNYWNGVWYSSAYIIVYRNGSRVGTSSPIYPPSSGSSYNTQYGSFSGLSQNTYYTAEAYAVAKNGTAYLAGEASFTTTGTPAPSTPSWYDAEPNSPTQITLDWYSVSGATYYEVNNQTTGETRTAYDSHIYWDGLMPDTTYRFRVRAGNSGGFSGWSTTITAKTPAERPSNYYWTYSKYSGGNFNLTADEWNKFTARINAFRTYKGWSNFDFDYAYRGNAFTAKMYNDARNAINVMYPSSLPPYRNKGDVINASDLNGLITALNSIS